MSIDLEHEVRAYAEYLDEILPTVTADRVRTGVPDRPRPVAAPPRWYRRPVVVFLAAMAVVLLVAVAQLPLLNGPTVTTTPQATGAFVCPPGSNPDQPGPADQPRPRLGGLDFMTFHAGSGQVLVLTGDDLWTFDVCTNTWTQAPGPGDIGLVSDFVYDVDSDRAVAFTSNDEGVARVASYEPATQTWTVKSEFVVRPTRMGPEAFLFPWLKAAYDPVTGLVVVLEPAMAAMWIYDVDTDTWTEIDHGTTWLPPGDPFFTYDASVDRLIVYHAHGSTWEYDLRAGQWEPHDTNSLGWEGFGWWSIGNEFVYDEANQVSVLFSYTDWASVSTYDASEHLWAPKVVKGSGGVPPMTYDPVNERIVMFVGDTYQWPGVIAYDVATGEWVTLLEPTTE